MSGSDAGTAHRSPTNAAFPSADAGSTGSRNPIHSQQQSHTYWEAPGHESHGSVEGRQLTDTRDRDGGHGCPLRQLSAPPQPMTP